MRRPLDPRRTTLVALVAATLTGVALAQAPAAQGEKPAKPRPAIEQYNLDKQKLAIDGYDPVAYFPEGGGKPKKGDKGIIHTHDGVTYRFDSEKNRELFKKSPARFEPAYGGWCSFAMRDGDKVEIDPKSFLIQNDRLLLFYDGLFADTRKQWRKGGADAQEKRADASWEELSGEKPPKKRRGE